MTLVTHRSPATLESEWYRQKTQDEEEIREHAREILRLCHEQWGDLGGVIDQALGFVQSEAGKMFPEGDRRPPLPGKARIPSSLRTLVYERDAYRCVGCGGHTALSIDHIIPESEGGPTTEINLQTLCRPCNSAKGTTMPDHEASPSFT